MSLCTTKLLMLVLTLIARSFYSAIPHFPSLLQAMQPVPTAKFVCTCKHLPLTDDYFILWSEGPPQHLHCYHPQSFTVHPQAQPWPCPKLIDSIWSFFFLFMGVGRTVFSPDYNDLFSSTWKLSSMLTDQTEERKQVREQGSSCHSMDPRWEAEHKVVFSRSGMI